MQSASFRDLGLSPELLKAVEKMGFEQASAIQSATIPALLSGKDVAGLSRTGSGKTAAFAIPAVECVDPRLRAPQVLILCPTRELAVQVAGEVAKLSAFKPGVKELAVYGGASYGTQFRGLEDGAQIIAGTPGRVMDHLDRGSLRLDSLKMIVLDEADRMLDMGFRDDMATILQQAPPNRQTAFFSATMPVEVERLIKLYTSTPTWVRLETRAEAAPDIDQTYYEVGHGSRVGALCRVLEATQLRFGIVFCSTKNAVDGVAEHLAAEGYQVDRLHGDISQAQRERVMRRFRDRKIEFLIATDVAARGIDVDEVEVVLNYDLPRDPEDYVHRIGRTGRAGRSGLAISFVTPREVFMLERIARLTRIRVRREKLPTAAEAARKRTEAVVNRVKLLIAEGGFPANKTAAEALLENGAAPEQVIAALLHLLVPPKAHSAAPQGGGENDEARTAARTHQGGRGAYDTRDRRPFNSAPRDERRHSSGAHPVSRQIRDPLPAGSEPPARPPRKPSFNKSRPWSAKASPAPSSPSRAPRRGGQRP
jgi:ATP-dependent RNA helicase DeaD